MLPFHSQLINFLKINISRNKHIYIIINTTHEGICVEFAYYTYFMNHPLNKIVDDFGE